jgi:hypothetical protein
MMLVMRTTVTLDDDVAAKLKDEASRRKTSFKEVLNSSVRRGLRAETPEAVEPYRLDPRRLGARPGVDLDRALALAGELEAREIARRLSLRK